MTPVLIVQMPCDPNQPNRVKVDKGEERETKGRGERQEVAGERQEGRERERRRREGGRQEGERDDQPTAPLVLQVRSETAPPTRLKHCDTPANEHLNQLLSGSF